MSKKSRENAEKQAESRAYERQRVLATYLVRDPTLEKYPRFRVAYELREAADDRISAEKRVAGLVAEARRQGLSWAIIGELLGVSRQAARQRYPEGN